MAVVIAIALDATGIPFVSFGARLRWLDLAAVVCLVGAACSPGAMRKLAVWATPLDGRVLSSLLLAAVLVLPGSGELAGAITLRQTLECAAIFYGLLVQARSQPGAAESLWEVVAASCVLMSAHALLGVTSGLDSLRAAARLADDGWAAQSGLFKGMLFVTVLCAGRALEAGSGRGWRVLTVLGVAGVALHAAAGGTGLHASTLARLDSPLHFSNVVIQLLLLSGLVRIAWDLRRNRREQASRWRAATLALLLLGVMGVFGGATGGAGPRALAAIFAVLLVATSEAPAHGEVVEMPEFAEQRKAA